MFSTRQRALGLVAWVVTLAMIGLMSTTAQARSARPDRADREAAKSGWVVKNKQGKMRAPVRDKSAAGSFKGTFTPEEFTVVDDTLMATGVVAGKVHKKGHKPQWASKTVTVPVQSVNGQSSGASGFRSMAATAVTCDVLNLVLGPLDLNLLGLEIHLDTVVLDIIANPAGGLLGNLLCAVANLLNGGPLAGLLSQIADLLNQILGALQLP